MANEIKDKLVTAESLKFVYDALNTGSHNVSLDGNVITIDGQSITVPTDAYIKPADGIAKSDLSSAVQTSLNKADTALQSAPVTSVAGKTGAVTLAKGDVGLGNVGNFKAVSTVASQGLTDTEKSNARANIGAGTGSYSKPSGGIPKTDLASAVQTSLGKADSALQSESDPTVPAWAKAENKPSYTASEVGALASTVTHLSGDIATSEKGTANGVATLGADGKIPSTQLPSFVDDVLEYNGTSAFPATGEAGKIYVDTSTNKTYRWGGSGYVVISETIAIGTTTGTALDGKVGNDHISSTSNPHGVTAAQVGLGNVGNFKAVSTVASQGLTNDEKSAARANIGAGTGSYSKPASGIPKSDLASAVQTSLGLADTALQSAPVTSVAGKTGAVTLAKGDVGLGNVTNNAQVKGLASGTTNGHVVTWGSDGYTVADSGYTIGKSVPSDAVFTDTTYESKAAASGGTAVSLVTTGEKYTWNNKGSYSKPSGGIPKTDLASAVQTSLGLADTALQSESDPTVSAWAKSTNNVHGIFYGTCTTAQSTKAKVATLTDGTGFNLAAGATIAIKFTNASAAATMTLDVDSTGAKNLVQYGTTNMSSKTTTDGWPAGAVVYFTYDGTSWVRNFWSNTTYNRGYVEVTTAAGTAAKTGSITSYALASNRYIFVRIGTANTAASALTLNINSAGAKPIYINGNASSSSNYTLAVGTYLVYYDGTNYYFRTDGKITGNITGTADGNATTTTYTATLGTTWTAASGYVTQDVTVTGITANDNPIVDIVTTTAAFATQQDEWGKVFKITTAANKITVYASEATTTALSLQLKVVR